MCQALNGLVVDPQYHIARPQSGLVRGAVAVDTDHRELVVLVVYEHSEPRTRWGRPATVRAKLVDDGCQELDRDEHIDRAPCFLDLKTLDNQRADAAKPAVQIQQGRSGPALMGRRREDGFVENVLPASSEFLLRDDVCLNDLWVGLLTPRDAYRVTDAERRRIPDFNCGAWERHHRFDQGEPTLKIVAHHECRGRSPVVGGDPDFLGLIDHISDRNDQPIFAQTYPVSRTLGPQQTRAHCVIRHMRPDGYQCLQRGFQGRVV